MVLFNHATREMTAKIVYYGPGLCGKTTNLMVIFDKLDEKNRGKMLSLATKTDRTLFFDLLPVEIGKVGAFNLKIQLYTVPGQVFYNETRKLVLKGADAIVFVADSQASMAESNKESYANLLDNMKENQIGFAQTPILIQYNKRDLPGVPPIKKLQEMLGFEALPWVEASALEGTGVMETFKAISKLTARHLVNKVKGKESNAKTLGRIEEAEVKKGKTTPAAAEAVKPGAPAPAPEPEIEEAPEEGVSIESPFGDSMNPPPDVAPFDESAVEKDYENVEEVSLDQLLAERERPKTLSGVAVPSDDEVEEIEELTEVHLEPLDGSSGGAEEIASLKAENERLKKGLRAAIAQLEKLAK